MSYEKVTGHEEEEVELHEGTQPDTVVEVRSNEAEERGENGVGGKVRSSEAEDAILVKVKSTDEKTHEVRISESETVRDLKDVLEELTGLPVTRQRLICLGRLLVDESSLKESSVTDGIFVHLVPKPEMASCRTSSGSNSGMQRSPSMDELELPPHIQQMLASRGEMPSFGGSNERPRFSFEEEYELSIWRYRVRVLSLLMLFYYFMTLMASLSMWLNTRSDNDRYHQQQGQFKQIKPDLPLSIIDTLENILGISVAVSGLKTAVRDNPAFSKKFARETTILAVVHFINLFMWIGALFRGEIIQVPVHHRYGTHDQDEEQESLRSIVGAMLIVHPMIWLAILVIAYRYHALLVVRHEILHPPPQQQQQEQQQQQQQNHDEEESPSTNV